MRDVILVTVSEGSNKYVICEDAEETLKKLAGALSTDDTTEIHKSILYDKVLKDQLIPLLLTVRFEFQTSLFCSVIRILCRLTSQFSSLNIREDKDTEEARDSYRKYLAKLKEEFNEPRFTWPLLKLLKVYTSQKKEDPSEISLAEAKECLRLIKNLLEIQEYEPTESAAALIAKLQQPSRHYSFIWYLVYQNFDGILLSLINEHQWSRDVAEIIRLMFNNVDFDLLKKSLQDWMITASISSSDPTGTYPGSSEPSRSRSNSRSNSDGSNPSPYKPSKDTEKTVDHEKSKPGKAELDSVSTRVSDGQPSDAKHLSPEIAKETYESHLFHAITLSGKSNSSISEHSATLLIEEEIEETFFERLKEKPPEAGTSNKRPRESEGGSDLPSKRQKYQLKDDKQQNNDIQQKKKRKSKSERDQIYKDLGFSSGITDQNSSGSEPLEPENWRVRISDLSDHGYASYLTDYMEKEKKYRKQLPFEKLTEEEKRERKKKFIEQRMTKKNVKLLTLPYDVVTESDVMEVLSDFSLNFLIKGYGVLTLDLLNELTKEGRTSCHRLKDNYSWLLYFFLPLAAEIDIPFNMIQTTYEVFHYIAGETIHSGLEILNHEGVPEGPWLTLKGYLQAQRCFMEVLSLYEQNLYLESIERYNLKLIILQIVRTQNIRQHYIFLLRLASTKNMLHKQYLENLVVVNHIHLTKMQQLNSSELEMTIHIKGFALPEMMKPYGFLLESFRENSPTLNDCIFTMMHHVAGDLVCPQALDIKPIPETIQQIVKQGVSLCDDWQDLIEYMMNYFTFKQRQSENKSSKAGSRRDDSSTCSQTSKQSKISQDKATQTAKPNKEPSPVSSSSVQVAAEPVKSPKSSMSLKGNEIQDTVSEASSSGSSKIVGKSKPKKQRIEEIRKILGTLKTLNLSFMVSWLKTSLLDLWRVKLYLAPNQAVSNTLVRNFIPLEPVPWFYANRVMDVPLVPFSSKVNKKLDGVHFQLLLKQLGLITLPKQPAIPISFTSREVLELAVSLGPVENKQLYPELLGENV